jgi:glycosyltransferase involved in cell wall biosynthesis
LSPRALVISAGAVGAGMAGPGIRSYELARALAEHAEVTLAAVAGPGPFPADVPLLPYDLADPRALRPAIRAADAVVAQPPWPPVAQWLRRSDARLIYDLYTPEPLELLEVLRGRGGPAGRVARRLILDRYLDACRDGHHFICASEKQRDLWLGTLLGEDRLGGAAYEQDPSLRALIDVVPFGTAASPPRPGPGPRERFPQLGTETEIVLWNGGIWTWLDAPCAIRAVGELVRRRPSVRLVFMGASDAVAGAGAAARAVAAELGLLDRVVVFNDAWLPYAERGAWLLQADCAISTHVDHLETRFAFRTRLLDCFWAGLPVVATEGDDLAALVEREDLGAAVPEGDPGAVATALELILSRGRAEYAGRLERTAQTFRWDSVSRPLVQFVTGAVPAPPPARRLLSAPGRSARASAYRAGAAALNASGLRARVKRAVDRAIG